MKKKCFLTLLICLLCVCLVLALAACGKDETDSGDKTREDTKTGQEENKADRTEQPGGKPDPKDDAADDIFGGSKLHIKYIISHLFCKVFSLHCLSMSFHPITFKDNSRSISLRFITNLTSSVKPSTY